MKQSSRNTAAAPLDIDKISTVLDNRPVFGGLLFLQMVQHALKKYPNHYLISASCTFYKPARLEVPIVYSIEYTQSVGKALTEIGISGAQNHKEDLSDAVTIRGKILMISSNIEHKEIIREYIPIKKLKVYLNENTVDKFLSPVEYLKSKEMEITETRKALYNTEYMQKKVHILDCPSGEKKRCIRFLCSDLGFSISEFSKNNSDALLLCYLSDIYLLETAIISEKEDITSEKYKILSITHEITFSNLDKFISTQPFFMSISIDAIRDNNAYCSAEIVQNNTLIAVVSQYGAIRAFK